MSWVVKTRNLTLSPHSEPPSITSQTLSLAFGECVLLKSYIRGAGRLIPPPWQGDAAVGVRRKLDPSHKKLTYVSQKGCIGTRGGGSYLSDTDVPWPGLS